MTVQAELRRTVALKAGVLVVGAAAFAAAAGPPLVSLVLLTRETVGVTGALLDETVRLQEESARVLDRLSYLPVQERLLAEQVRLTTDLQVQLTGQERLSAEAEALLIEILRAEKVAARETLAAHEVSQRTFGVLVATGEKLERVAAATTAVKSGSRRMEEQVQTLLVEMREHASLFAGVRKWKQAADDWWQSVRDWFRWGRDDG